MNVARASKAEKSAAEALARALERQGFAGDEDLLAALIGEDELAALEVEVAAHRDAVHEAKGRLQQALAWAAAHPETAELAAVEQAAAAAAAAAREALTAANLARADSDNLDRTRDALDDLAAESADADDRYAVVGRLADVATGQAQGAKVSFQRWVLGAYLDDVLRAASQRLESMSKGRYLLERQKEAADMKKASGLDLAVYDGWHNRQRPAVTLSGGESFHAALALALGLAETVQSESGGTRLETIFIDEGFGALDRDALDAAVDALMDLQDSGRLVGVISHVPELRGVIDARLEVTGGPDGSHTRFVVQ